MASATIIDVSGVREPRRSGESLLHGLPKERVAPQMKVWSVGRLKKQSCSGFRGLRVHSVSVVHVHASDYNFLVGLAF